MSLVGVLMGGLRMLLCGIGVLLAFGMIALAVMFGGGAVSLGCTLMVFSSFVMFVLGHFSPRWLFAPSRRQIAHLNLVPERMQIYRRTGQPPLCANSKDRVPKMQPTQ
jgi:hypothetical protein